MLESAAPSTILAPDGPIAIDAAEAFCGGDSGVVETPGLSIFETMPADSTSEVAAAFIPFSASEEAYYLSCLQAMIFVSGDPVTPKDAARALSLEPRETARLLDQLMDSFQPGGLQIVRVAGGYQMTTRPEFTGVVARFLQPLPQKLSKPALETLALIAYRQPLTLPEIESVRGVKCDSSVRTLMERGLIEDAGRKEVIGRPILYRTTTEFLGYMGVNDLADLPPCEFPTGTPDQESAEQETAASGLAA